jgi:hypothetical protein
MSKKLNRKKLNVFIFFVIHMKCVIWHKIRRTTKFGVLVGRVHRKLSNKTLIFVCSRKRLYADTVVKVSRSRFYVYHRRKLVEKFFRKAMIRPGCSNGAPRQIPLFTFWIIRVQTTSNNPKFTDTRFQG